MDISIIELNDKILDYNKLEKSINFKSYVEGHYSFILDHPLDLKFKLLDNVLIATYTDKVIDAETNEESIETVIYDIKDNEFTDIKNYILLKNNIRELAVKVIRKCTDGEQHQKLCNQYKKYIKV